MFRFIRRASPRGWYAHVSQQMRDELLIALQVRWEDSLRQRATIDPHSPVPLLDDLLAPYRDGTAPATAHPIRHRRATTDTGEMISQIFSQHKESSHPRRDSGQA